MSKASEYAARIMLAEQGPKDFVAPQLNFFSQHVQSSAGPFRAGVTPSGHLFVDAAKLAGRDVPAFIAWLRDTFLDEGAEQAGNGDAEVPSHACPLCGARCRCENGWKASGVCTHVCE